MENSNTNTDKFEACKTCIFNGQCDNAITGGCVSCTEAVREEMLEKQANS